MIVAESHFFWNNIVIYAPGLGASPATTPMAAASHEEKFVAKSIVTHCCHIEGSTSWDLWSVLSFRSHMKSLQDQRPQRTASLLQSQNGKLFLPSNGAVLPVFWCLAYQAWCCEPWRGGRQINGVASWCVDGVWALRVCVQTRTWYDYTHAHTYTHIPYIHYNTVRYIHKYLSSLCDQCYFLAVVATKCEVVEPRPEDVGSLMWPLTAETYRNLYCCR